MDVRDARQRPLRSLRISVTDRCNLRCAYCMPEESYTWLPRGDLLTFEEIVRLARAFVASGVDKLRLTGGEPLLRQDLPELVRLLREIDGVADLALTTNGVLLAALAPALRAAGLDRITISLDTLDAARFHRLTRRPDLPAVLSGIEAARDLFGTVKLDTVVVRGENDAEIPDLLRFARERACELRFIEYMDVGGATRWQAPAVVSRDEILAAIATSFGPPRAMPRTDAAPADRYLLPDGTVFGIIASTTVPFCGTCDRARLTADGRLFLCLYARVGHDLREPLRRGAGVGELAESIARIWGSRSDAGAEERVQVASRGASLARADLLADPHLEMHTKGG